MKRKHLILISIIFSFTICNAQYITLYTPNGSPVETFFRTEGTTEWITNTTNAWASAYQNAQVLAPASRTYNCHSYAWNLSAGGTQYVWMNQLDSYDTPNIWKYWTDTSYSETNEVDAEKIFYFDGDHSAIKSTSIVGKYESKWGEAPLMRHDPTYVPYNYPTHQRYYKKSLPIISGSSSFCNQESYSINLPTGLNARWGVSPSSGIVSYQINGNSITLTKVSNGNVLLTDTINSNTIITKNISVGAPFYLGISEISNLTMWDAGNFQVLPGSGYYAYEGTLTLSDGVGLPNTSYVWSFVSGTSGKPITWWSSGGWVDVAMKASNTYLTLKCTVSNYCGSYTQYYSFTNGDIIPMLLSPNPSSTQVEVSVPDAVRTNSVMTTTTQALTPTENLSAVSYSVTVVDSYGLIVYTATVKDKKFIIPTSSLRNGIYSVVVSDGTNVYQKKLIVKH